MHSSASDFQRLVDMRTNPKIYDCFIFFNELDILDIRLNTLDKDVDYFVLVESTRFDFVFF